MTTTAPGRRGTSVDDLASPYEDAVDRTDGVEDDIGYKVVGSFWVEASVGHCLVEAMA